MTREELIDEIWEAMMRRMDAEVSTTELAEAVLDHLKEIGAFRSGLIEGEMSA